MQPHFKTIALVGRYADARVAEAMQTLANEATALGLAVAIDAACALSFIKPVQRLPEHALSAVADLMVAVGGDGTLLHAARLVAGTQVPLLGINRGQLGFLADVDASGMLERYTEVLTGKYTRDVRFALTATIRHPDRPPLQSQGLNDIVLHKRDTGRMLDFETWIDGTYVNTPGGDGLVVATPTGSTGYALSCGGPILVPTLDAIVLAPICPHTLSDRPIVVSAASRIEVKIVAQAPIKTDVTTDGVVLGDMHPNGRLTIERAAVPVTLLHPPGYDFYAILRSKLHWGRGTRRAAPSMPTDTDTAGR